MKKNFIIILLLLCSSTLLAQKDFQPGYYIDNQGNKIEGYLKTFYFKSCNDPTFTSFDFKKELNQPTEIIEKVSVTEFGFGSDYKYQKRTVLIDDSSIFRNYSTVRDFDPVSKTVFLNVIVEGTASLYEYDGDNGIKFFYKFSGNDNKIEQLLYKMYLMTQNRLAENFSFREQLFNNLKCPNQVFSDFLNIKYDKEELIKVVNNYNMCNNSTSIVYENKIKKAAKFRFGLLAGYSVGQFKVEEVPNPTDVVNFGIFNIGAEMELLFPSKKVGLYFSTKYKKVSTEASSTTEPSTISPIATTYTYKVDGSLIDLVIGGRYYKNFKDAGSVFLGAGFGISSTSGSFDIYQSTSLNPKKLKSSGYELSTSQFVTFQVGYVYKGKYAIDINYDLGKNLTQSINGTSTNLNELGISLKYIF